MLAHPQLFMWVTLFTLETILHITILLDQHFFIKNLSDLTYFLELGITRNKIGIYLSQRKYTLDFLIGTGMLACTLVPTPMVHFAHLSTEKNSKLNKEDSTSYRRLFGHLI